MAYGRARQKLNRLFPINVDEDTPKASKHPTDSAGPDTIKKRRPFARKARSWMRNIRKRRHLASTYGRKA